MPGFFPVGALPLVRDAPTMNLHQVWGWGDVAPRLDGLNLTRILIKSASIRGPY